MDTLLPSEADPIQLASTPARGRRPEFTDDPMVDRLYSVALVLSAELAVTRLRLDALERVLDRGEVVARKSVEDFRPEPHEAAERARLQREYLDRVFRAVSEVEARTDQRKAG